MTWNAGNLKASAKSNRTSVLLAIEGVRAALLGLSNHGAGLILATATFDEGLQ